VLLGFYRFQFRNLRTHDAAEFKDARTRVLVSADAFASGEWIYPARGSLSAFFTLLSNS
jgi:hypothetical protein